MTNQLLDYAKKTKTKNNKFGEKVKKLSNQALSFYKKFQKIILSVLLVVVLAGAGFFVWTETRAEKYDISIEVYKSRGNRDPNKIKQDEFNQDDYIQAKMIFNNIKDQTDVYYYLYEASKLDKNPNEFLYRVRITIKDSGERPITVQPSASYKLMEGNSYYIVIKKDETNKKTGKSEEKVIAKKEFKIK